MMCTVAAVHQEMHDWASRQQEVRQEAEHVSPVLLPEEERRNREKDA
jgi:hypothetical protein